MKKTDLTSKELYEALKKGEERKVFDQLYKNCFPKINNFILKNNGNKDESQDVFQDAMLIFYKQFKLNRTKDQHDVNGYIYTIGKNLWINRAKKLNKQIELEDHNHPLHEDNDGQSQFITKERRKIILNVLNLLGDRCKDLLIYTIYHNLKLEDIRKKMGFETVNAVKTKHYKCKQRLIKLVKDNVAFKNHLQNG